MSRILPLPPDAISQIYSSKHITALRDVVLALLENSLDANATKVEVSVDFPRAGCTVEDDGDGIADAEFADDGGLGKMHCTSKRLTDWTTAYDLHGCNGTFLASLASLSLLNIISQRREALQQSSLTMHQGKAIQRSRSRSEPGLGARTTHGTQVSVRDLFGNMPVRVKQRALAQDRASDDERAWQQLKHGITALLLAWRRPCSVKITDVNNPDRKVNLVGSRSSTGADLTRTALQQLGTGRAPPFGVADALPLVFQAGFAAPDTRPQWVPVSASAVDLTIRGLICLEPAPTRQCQFVSLGILPCMQSSGSSEIYEAINRIFTNSNFGATNHLSEPDEAEKDRRKRNRNHKSKDYVNRQLRSRKGVDRWPMFILQVKFRGAGSISRVPGNMSGASLKSIISILEATITQWLTAYHFRPRNKRPRRKDADQLRHAPALTSSENSFVNSADAVTRLDRTISVEALRPDRPSTANTIGKLELGVCVRQDLSNARPAYGGHSPFGAWSRIKSSRQEDPGKYDRRASMAAHSTSDIPATAPPSPKASAFVLPAIEAGALSTARQQHARLNTFGASPSVSTTGPGKDFASSENFGSIDDADFIAAAADSERRHHSTYDGESPPTTCADDIVDWTDPKTKQQYRVNSRTGVTILTTHLSRDGNLDSAERLRAPINTTLSSRGAPLSLAQRDRPPSSTTRDNEWLPGFLREWRNPIFEQRTEERIPVASTDGPCFEADDVCGKRGAYALQEGAFDADTRGTNRFTKASLFCARVIGQVDRKFILCALPATGHGGIDEETLVLVDQHAASERVILENLLADFCEPAADDALPTSVKTTALEKPIRFQISKQEHGLFHFHAPYFSSWGIVYVLSQQKTRPPASQDVRHERQEEHLLTVTYLPPAIAERCTLVPKVLIELLRTEIWSLATSNNKPRPPPGPHATGEDPGHSWLRLVGSCPKGIVDLLNSRACRSAIMFNDELSIAECMDLVAQLSRCAFPFMCAHGRISMVPVGGLGGGAGIGAAGEEREKFSASFATWAGRKTSCSDGDRKSEPAC